MNKYRENYYDDTYVDDESHNEYTKYDKTKEEPLGDIRQKPQRITPPQENGKKPKKKKKLIWRVLIRLATLILSFFLLMLALGYVMSFFKPTITNVLIMATDEDGTRTDTLMLVSFNKKTDKLSIVSIPRDTYVKVSDDSFAKMREEYPQPSYKSMKINAVHHYGGEKYGVGLLISEVEALLGLDIDYHVKVDFEAFRYIIDSVGGIDFYVPRNMKYSDPLQNLNINLTEGMQHLDGEKAEQVLRYRSGYANADIGRISVQQDFMKAFIEQNLSKSTIVSHPFVYINTIFKYNYIKTNARVMDMISYALLLGGIDSSGINTQTLPGQSAMRGGQSVYLPDMAKTNGIVNEILRN